MAPVNTPPGQQPQGVGPGPTGVLKAYSRRTQGVLKAYSSRTNGRTNGRMEYRNS